MAGSGSKEYVNFRIRDRQLSIALAALFLLWYIVQLVSVVWLEFTASDLRYWFKIASLTDPSPGWIFAVVSHAQPPNFHHLLVNVIGIAVFGGAMEKHLSRREFLIFFFVTGIGSLFAQVASGYALGQRYAAFGASGALFGFATMYGTHHLLRNEEVSSTEQDDSLRVLFYETRRVFAHIGPLFILIILLLQYQGIVYSGLSATITHLVGAIAGIAFAAIRHIDLRRK